MKQKFRDGTVILQPNGQDRFLAALYGSAAGRLLLKPLTAPIVSKAAGRLLSTKASRLLIKPFIRKNGIDMSQFEEKEYESYNDFFSRKIRPSARTVDMEPEHLVSPCDSKLTAMPVSADGQFSIKHSRYSLASLIRDRELAAEFEGGMLLLFRLTVDDYHRYCFPAHGLKGESVKIPGILHTVNPVANDYFPVYKENSREYCIIRSEAFGDMLMMEVGALLVGKIDNYPAGPEVEKGQEKGRFLFGGSTVILLLKQSAAEIDGDILNNSAEGYETVVRYGEKIASAKK